MKTPNTYQEAFEELQTLIKQIESGHVSIDMLSEQVKRATQLIEVCKQKLFATEKDVQELLQHLQEDRSTISTPITQEVEPKTPEEGEEESPF